MKTGIILKDIIPFLTWYATLIFLALFFDFVLHYLDFVFIGRYLGYLGTFTILLSFLYSLNKRKVISFATPKVLLDYHEYFALSGSILILVHAGIHFNALLPWLAVGMLLINVASGLVGKHLLQRANKTSRERKLSFKNEGMSPQEMEKELFWDSVSMDAMKQWRTIHLPITYFLALLSLIHILSVIFFH